MKTRAKLGQLLGLSLCLGKQLFFQQKFKLYFTNNCAFLEKKQTKQTQNIIQTLRSIKN